MASELKNTNDENTYVNDPESGAEMLRLLDQDRTLTRCMGGLLAEQSGVEGLQDVLDIACGPGGWFDLVNARTIAGFMRTSDWPALVQECVRILRPGGILRFTETDLWGKT